MATRNAQGDRSCSSTLKSAMMLLLGDRNRTEDEQTDNHLIQQPFSMHILVHGIACGVLELNRNMPSASSKSVRLLRSTDFKSALTRWRRHFDLMNQGEQLEGLSLSALICYHLTYVLIDADVHGILKETSLYTPDGKFLTLGTGSLPLIDPEGQDVYPHLLQILQLCFDGSNASNKGLCIARIEVLTVVIMWVYVREAIRNEPQQQELEQNKEDSVDKDIGHSMDPVEDMLRRENPRASTVYSNLATMKRDFLESIRVAQDRVSNDTSEFGMS